MKTTPVANHVLWIAYKHKHDADLTPSKLQRLLYFLHGSFLAATGQLLLTEPFTRGPYGPTLASLQDTLAAFHGIPVDDYIHEFDPDTCTMRPFFVSYEGVPQFEAVLNEVWAQYGRRSLGELSSIAHGPGSPWEKTQPGDVIRDELLLKHFRAFASSRSHTQWTMPL